MRGIYAITNAVTDTVYYGQSVNMGKRLDHHVWKLHRRRHDNPRLQRAWDKHGADAFTFRPLWIMPFGDLTKWERACIAGRRATGGRCYNMQDPLHIEPVCAETRAKISASSLGKKMSAEACANMSLANFRRPPPTVETRAKQSASAIGNKNSLGHKVTPEACAKMMAVHIGRKHSIETRAKMSISGKRRWARERVAKLETKKEKEKC
jgi:group I intron endonuclease